MSPPCSRWVSLLFTAAYTSLASPQASGYFLVSASHLTIRRIGLQAVKSVMYILGTQIQALMVTQQVFILQVIPPPQPCVLNSHSFSLETMA